MRLYEHCAPFFFFSTPRDLVLVAALADLGMATGVGDFLVRFFVAVFAAAGGLAAALAIVAEVQVSDGWKVEEGYW